MNERTALFNGIDIDDWRHTGEGCFEMVKGHLKSVGGMGLLWYSKQKFGGCRIVVVYKCLTADANSGVFVRISEPPAGPMDAVNGGYEIQILDDADEYHATGTVYTFSKQLKKVNSVDDWNTMEITLSGESILVDINGSRITEFNPADEVPPRKNGSEPKPGHRHLEGYIGLQNHDPDSVVLFKEITVYK